VAGIAYNARPRFATAMNDLPRHSPLKPPLPRAGDRHTWRRLYGSARSLAIARLAQAHPSLLLVVTRDPVVAEELLEEIRFFLGEQADLPVALFPGWETLPYDQFSPYQDIISDRLAMLARLPQMQRGVIVASLNTVSQRMCPPSFVAGNSFNLRAGDRVDRDEFRRQLEQAGYRANPQVMEHGDFAVRGSLIDLFPMGSDVPYRLDLLDDEIDTIRTFDPETQVSTGAVEALRLLPAREFPLTEKAIAGFRQRWRERFEGKPTNAGIYNDVSEGFCPAGIEYYLPLFFEATATFFDYLPAQALVVLDEGIVEAAEAFRDEVAARYEQGRHDIQRPLLPPNDLFVPAEELFAACKAHGEVFVRGDEEAGSAGLIEFDSVLPTAMPVDSRAPQPFLLLDRFLATFAGRVLIAAESAGRRETLLDVLGGHALKPAVVDGWQAFEQGSARLCLAVAPLAQGALLPGDGIAVIAESQLFGERVVQQRRRRAQARDPESIIRDLTELRSGSPVVHEQHGVGRYRGLVTLEVDGIAAEYLHLEYADGDKLYVPVSALHFVSRYTGIDPDLAPLHKLGTSQWAKARARAAERARDVAAELLDIHARRAARQGHRFKLDQSAYNAFVEKFPFEETVDQAAAIEGVLKDMQSEQPMDRLVCGDVGFGKTEVAMRAAFVAVQDGWQVAVLVPTTLLAQQHYQNFKDRFADWPVRIEQLSRFRGKKEQDTVVAGLADGAVDIVIGTHKLIQPGIKFKRLGLIIVDEEHRFGVQQKEQFKKLRAEVDILTLTATPIPRTLNLALTNVRELSIIATPPSRRLAVKTFVREWDDVLLKEALLREVSRGGQVYFLHNDVETIDKMAATVAELIPQARVAVAHGQMRERDLERVMLDFYHRRFNVLVCTTIIETGIDVPTANTIIINRADRFGLAQLYQLRGRVGRSHHRAYAYLLVPSRFDPETGKKTGLGGDAQKRLEAIESLEELGMGFTLATHDLEIRGAGEILGEEQSGHIQEVGFAMYAELLERAVKSLKAGKQPQLDAVATVPTEINLHIPALFPDDYIPDVHTRLILYKRISGAVDEDTLMAMREEVIDRFGPLPPPAQNVFLLTRAKMLADALGLRKIDMNAQGGRLLFDPQPKIDPVVIIRLVQQQPRHYKLEGGDKLRILKPLPEQQNRIDELFAMLALLSGKAAGK
jgi:transcription-repair coupling factor (superfamily II helicase)